MTHYINWMQKNQVQAADTLQTQGNPADDYESPADGVASGVAPEGALYACIWGTAVFKVTATNLKDPSGLGSTKEVVWPANIPLEIINIQPGKTTITMTAI